MEEKTRVEVLRYLGTPLNNHHQPKKKNKATSQQAEKVHYTDPVSKNVFRSMKAVIRHVETEELEMVAHNTKGSTEKELEDNKTFSTSVIKKQQSAVSRARRHINFSQSLDMNDIEQEEQQHFSTQLLAPSEHASEKCQTGIALSNSDPQEAQVSEPKGGEGDSPKSTFVLLPADNAVMPAKKFLEVQLVSPESAKAEPGLCKSKKKKVPELPRRASKRLAGLEVDPVPELKPRTRARRVVVEQSCDEVAGTDKGSSHGNGVTDASKTAESEEPVGNVKAITNCEKNRGFHVLSLVSQNPPCEQQRNVETSDTKLGVSLELPFNELLTDPCIAFAIKTLTGINFGCSESSEVLPGSISSSEHSSANLASEIFKVEIDNKVGRKEECSQDFPSGNMSSLEELSEPETRADEKLVSPIDLPCESWQDPCIEFAIKTLTNDIPVDYDPNIQQYFQQQLSSARPGGSDHDTSLTSVSIDTFRQTEYSCQQFHNVVEKPGLALMHNRQSSCRSARNQSGKERQ
ncbi:methyl-CpG-binding domain-containing protein 13 isoform X2 [Humulus lupulus]|uniref:methyl-CpG-binding domain-containing protein 13 isoform X2 n=1 Tax=Humulus lupulus TaxID=3486 RepID=UPI002B411881|nr:methyl-CpG-binding domain-containing protein 13 isoform X2 [Humulus lupulus]